MHTSLSFSPPPSRARSSPAPHAPKPPTHTSHHAYHAVPYHPQICADEGASAVAIAARTTTQLDETAALIAESHPSVEVYPLTVDVCSADDVEGMVERAVEAMGGIDLLVNNAGGASAKG